MNDDQHAEDVNDAPSSPEDSPTTNEPVTPPDKRFRAATDAELAPQSFIVANDRSALRAVLRGGSIERTKGDAEFIGDALRRLAAALRQTAEHYRDGRVIGSPMLRRLEFGASVTIEIEVSTEESVVRDLDDKRHSPSPTTRREAQQRRATLVSSAFRLVR